MECYEHDFLQTHCMNCGGFLGEVCQNCGYLSDGGDFMASQEEIWCRCSDSVSDYDFENGQDYGEKKGKTMNKALVLPKDVQAWLDGQSKHGKNVYTCDTCGGEVVTVDIEKGVTPFMISCRATSACKGFMQSSFYHCDPARVAQYEWYRPETIDGFAKETKEHVMKGGLLLRPVTPWLTEIKDDA